MRRTERTRLTLRPRRDERPDKFLARVFGIGLLGSGLLVVAFSLTNIRFLKVLAPLLGFYALALAGILLPIGYFISRTSYRLTGEHLVVVTPLGRQRVRASQVLAVRRVGYQLPLALGRQGDTVLPGYYHQHFHWRGLSVEAITGASRGAGILLILRHRRALLLNPEDPLPLLRWKRRGKSMR